jgi:hypothetical protein
MMDDKYMPEGLLWAPLPDNTLDEAPPWCHEGACIGLLCLRHGGRCTASATFGAPQTERARILWVKENTVVILFGSGHYTSGEVHTDCWPAGIVGLEKTHHGGINRTANNSVQALLDSALEERLTRRNEWITYVMMTGRRMVSRWTSKGDVSTRLVCPTAETKTENWPRGPDRSTLIVYCSFLSFRVAVSLECFHDYSTYHPCTQVSYAPWLLSPCFI